MTEDVENLILEHLRVLRSSVDRVGESLNDLKARVGQVEERMAGMRRDMSTESICRQRR